MNGPDFLDSNILVYAYERTASPKREIAQSLVRRALVGEAIFSTQVLAELASTLLHQFNPRAEPSEVEKVLNILDPIRIIQPSAATVRRALDVRARYGIHFYDGMIVAAAERGGCSRIWSEDLNPGQTYFGITVENPFA